MKKRINDVQGFCLKILIRKMFVIQQSWIMNVFF